MTYCLGWKSETAAFLIADSAVTDITDYKQRKDLPEKTTFCEQQGSIDNGKKYVYERAFKLYSINKVAITLAGDVRFGNKVIELIKENLEYGIDVHKAIENSVNNYPDFSSQEHIQILVACCEDKPEIYLIDNKRQPCIGAVSDIACIGSPPEVFRECSLSFYKSFKESRKKEEHDELADETFLLRMLAFLQSYGVHHPTIEKGIGGTYSGLYVNIEKINWQPDIYYLIHGQDVSLEINNFASVFIRDNYKFIITDRNNIVLSNVVDKDAVDKSYSEEDVNYIDYLYEGVNDSFNNGLFKYIVFINFTRHVVTIVHMNYEIHHRYVCIDIQEKKKGTIGLMLNGNFNHFINDYHVAVEGPYYTVINYIPFIPIGDKQLELINSNLQELRISKLVDYGALTYKAIVYDAGAVKCWFYVKSLEEVFAFIKHYSHEEKIHIINRASDMVELEYVDGIVVFPDIKDFISNIFSQIPDKKTEKNIYLFDLLMVDNESNSSVQYTIQALANNWKEANMIAESQVKSEIGNCFILTQVGVQFYHPVYY